MARTDEPFLGRWSRLKQKRRQPEPEPEPGDAPQVEDAEPAPARKINYADEECFHDEWGKAIDPAVVPVVESFEACTAPENRFVLDWLGDVRGPRFADLGCGAGGVAV